MASVFSVPELLHSPFDRRSLPAYIMLGAMAGAAAILCVALGFSVAPGSYLRVFRTPALMVLTGYCLRRIGKPDFGGAMEASGLVYIQGVPAFLWIIPLIAISGPLTDATLTRWDALLGFDWLSFDHAIASWRYPLLIAYQSFLWQPALICFTLFLTGLSDRGWQFVTIGILAQMLCGSLIAFFPAVGPAVYHGVPQLAGEPFAAALEAVKGDYRVIDGFSLKGVVSFPSYHGAAATICTWALWPTRLRWPALALNVAMAVSAIVIGPHYLVDIIAGIAVATITILFVVHLSPRFVARGGRSSSVRQ